MRFDTQDLSLRRIFSQNKSKEKSDLALRDIKVEDIKMVLILNAFCVYITEKHSSFLIEDCWLLAHNMSWT